MVSMPEKPVAYIPLTGENDSQSEEMMRRFFEGEALGWSLKRMRDNGEIIIPKYVAIDLNGSVKEGKATSPHRVFYVEHKGIMLTDAGHYHYHRHHVVCDCGASRNFNDGDGGININACPDLRAISLARTRRIGRAFLSESAEIESNINKIIVMSDKVAVDAIETVLLLGKKFPEQWPGLAVSDEMTVEEACEVTGEPEENVVMYIDELRSRRSITFDGHKIRLAAA
jgi:hypothetical protein